VLFLFRELQLAAQIFFRLSFAELSAHPCGKFQRFKWRRDHVVSAEIECPRALQCSALHHHQHPDRFCFFPRLDLGDDSAAAQIGRRSLRNHQLRPQCFDLFHIQR